MFAFEVAKYRKLYLEFFLASTLAKNLRKNFFLRKTYFFHKGWSYEVSYNILEIL